MYIGEKKWTKEKKHRFYLGMIEYVLIYSQHVCLSMRWDSFLVLMTFLGKLILINLCEGTGNLSRRDHSGTKYCSPPSRVQTHLIRALLPQDWQFHKNRGHIHFHSLLNPHCPRWCSVSMLVENLSKSIMRPVKEKGKVIRSKHVWALWTFLHVYYFFYCEKELNHDYTTTWTDPAALASCAGQVLSGVYRWGRQHPGSPVGSHTLSRQWVSTHAWSLDLWRLSSFSSTNPYEIEKWLKKMIVRFMSWR